MRFRTRDLLIGTLLVAVWTAAFASGLFGDSAAIADDARFAWIIPLAFILPYLGLERRYGEVAGRSIVALPRQPRWKLLLCLTAYLFASATVKQLMGPEAGPPGNPLPWLALGGAIYAFMESRSHLHEHGLMLGAQFLPFADYFFEIRRGDTAMELVGTPKVGQTKRPLVEYWPVVPEALIKQVEQVLRQADANHHDAENHG